jgi:SAM-dependent methyltransferase
MSELLPEEQVTVDTYNAVADIWNEEQDNRGFWDNEMQRFHQLLPAGKVLEICSGGVRDAKAMIELGYDYTGTDVSEKLIEALRAKLPPDTKLYHQSVYGLEFPDGPKFDGFWAAAVLLHVPKSRIDEALTRIRSVVKPGALGFISVKDGVGEGMVSENWGDEVHDRFIALYSQPEFQDKLTSNGFTAIEHSLRTFQEESRWHCFFVRAA